MALTFDFFASLGVLILLSGGFVHRFGGVYVDLASVDTAAMLSFVLLLFMGPNSLARSRILSGLSRLLDHPKAGIHTRIFFAVTFSLLFAAHVAKHWSLNTDGFDLSFVHQALFHPLRGPFLPADISPSGSALGEHLLFSLIPLTLITSWIRVDELIFFIQTLSIALPLGLLVFRGPLRDRRGLALWLALILTLSNRSLRNALMFDFREDCFAFLGFSIALLSLHRGRIASYASGLILALLSKEHIPLIAPFLAVPILFSRDLPFSKRTRLRLAVGTILVSGVYLIVAFKVLLPYFNPIVGKASPLAYRFKEFGSTPSDILFNLVTVPKNWLILGSHLLNKQAVIYLLMLLLPRFALFFSKEAFLWAVPGLVLFGLNILSGHPGQTAMIFHYDLAGLPFLVWGTLIGIREVLLPALDRLDSGLKIKRTALLLLLALSVSDKWPLFHLTFNIPDLEQIRAHSALLSLDPEVPVLANSRLSAQVNAHDHLLVRDTPCSSLREAELGTFSGYRILDHRLAPNPDCPAPGVAPLFQNREISIYRYPIEAGSAKLSP
jgi:uncharacterized membrane protein